jgi:hypothetical protein
MARVRSPEDIRREMEFIRNSTERAREIEQAGNNPDWESNSTTLITLIKSTPISVPTWWVRFYDIPGADQLPNVLQYLCLAYADLLPEAKVIYQYPATIGTTFFTRYVSQIQYRLEQAANDLLNEGKIDTALALVRANGREVLNVPTCGRDRFGRRIEGRTLLQMAGMAGDVNLREKKTEEKEDHGAVELLAQAAGLTKDEVTDQLFPVLFSEGAKKENETRKQRVLTVLIKFAESILKRKAELPTKWHMIEEFKAAQAKCQPEIDKLRNDLLRIVSNQIIISGYILDSQIFVDLTQWFEKPENLKRFDGWWSLNGWWSLISDLFWVNGYGLLQYVAAARDAQVCHAGIGPVVNDRLLPARSLKNSDGSSHFDSSSKLGLDFFLGYYGGRERRFTLGRRAVDAVGPYVGNLMSSKNKSIAKFMQCPDSPAPKRRACVVM